MKIAVAEMFYSIQGEGATMGVPAVFLRLAGCNLMCGGYGTENDKALHGGARWRCDTIEVWRSGNTMTVEDLVTLFKSEGLIDRINKQKAHLVITGGEPVLQGDALVMFIEELLLQCPNVYIELETNGTVIHEDLFDRVDQINCSPKLANSGMPFEKRIVRQTLEHLNGKGLNTFFKFVVENHSDLCEVNLIVMTGLLAVNRVYLMPAADNRGRLSEIAPIVAEMCKVEGYRFSTRLQIELWNTCTGV